MDSPLADPQGQPSELESLACVTCRSRKLKCDRLKPACSRCSKARAECIYPGSRRRPTSKRRNVRDLEERLAQVEGFLRESGASVGGSWLDVAEQPPLGGFGDFAIDVETMVARNVEFQNASALSEDVPRQDASIPTSHPGDCSWDTFSPSSGELMSLGLSEALPPVELMENLNNTYFQSQHQFMPIIHPGRYLQAFYSAPHKRPPMGLQYAIWAMASNGHEGYSHYHGIFYQRARQYLEADEMRGSGEHFVTITHAQAWALVATYEARKMVFTRAAMSSAKAVRLVEMMGLHRLDGEGHEMAPTLVPPRDWTDLEERRRTFWGVFSIDTHASLSTGWPVLINPSDIATNLPSSEEAFVNEREEKTPTLPEAVKGASYSTFGGTLVVCHIFNELLRHVHRPQHDDHPEDLDNGKFWKRHRELENTLSTVFMFLPEKFRMPQSLRAPPALYTNLNLHAAIICLHHASVAMVDKHNLSDTVRKTSQIRLLTAAEEIVNLVRLTSHINVGYKSPLAGLSIYCAASVYIYIAKCDPANGLSNADTGNLEFIIQAMEAIGRNHLITQAFLQQVCNDVENNGLAGVISLPNLSKYRHVFGWASSNIPLLARSHVSNHTEIQAPLPGRLPLGIRRGVFISYDASGPPAESASSSRDEPGVAIPPDTAPDNAGNNKRKRASPGIGSVLGASADVLSSFDWDGSGVAEGSSPAYEGNTFGAGLLRATGAIDLPHRTSSTFSPSLSLFNTNTLPNQLPDGGVAPARSDWDSLKNSGEMYGAMVDQIQRDGVATSSFTDQALLQSRYPGTEPAVNASSCIDPWTTLGTMESMTWPPSTEGQGEGRAGAVPK